MVALSLKAGQFSDSHKSWDTIRMLRFVSQTGFEPHVKPRTLILGPLQTTKGQATNDCHAPLWVSLLPVVYGVCMNANKDESRLEAKPTNIHISGS
jgi:hypothetical protein